MTATKYPIYVPSKGRWESGLTAKMLIKDKVPFRLVIEEQEREHYVNAFGEEHVLVLPFQNRGSVIPSRNWIKQHATEEGHERHWQLDDNIRAMRRRWKDGKRIRCPAGVALKVCEDFTDRYENIAVSGLNYTMFAIDGDKLPPFYLNARVYSCSLVLNSIPHQWRGTYNEDTDLCLQVLADGWCTVLINAFLAEKMRTMNMKGGNTTEIYQGDGRAKMARSLERVWPGVVETRRRFQRPQHVVKYAWQRFDTPLKRRKDVDFSEFKRVDEYGLELKTK